MQVLEMKEESYRFHVDYEVERREMIEKIIEMRIKLQTARLKEEQLIRKLRQERRAIRGD